MSSDNKRMMTSKWFLSLASRNSKGAEAFLAAHKLWLETGELASEAQPILAKIDSKEVLPVPGLEALKKIAFDHFMISTQAKVEKQIEDSNNPKVNKPYTAFVYDPVGNVVSIIDASGKEKELKSSFDHAQDAERWCQRKLFEGSSSWTGKVVYNRVIGKSGTPMSFKIERTSAMGALAKKNKTPFMHYNKVSGGLRNKMSVSPSHVRFSRG